MATSTPSCLVIYGFDSWMVVWLCVTRGYTTSCQFNGIQEHTWFSIPSKKIHHQQRKTHGQHQKYHNFLSPSCGLVKERVQVVGSSFRCCFLGRFVSQVWDQRTLHDMVSSGLLIRSLADMVHADSIFDSTILLNDFNRWSWITVLNFGHPVGFYH